MPRTDETHAAEPVRPRRSDAQDGQEDGAGSKTRRKAAMHALQDIGEMLVELEPRQFAKLVAEVELPERLRDAVIAARSITARGGRKRQLQYVGRLMRDLDAGPVARWLKALAEGRQLEAAQQHRLEGWRERLLDEPDALDALAARHPTLDRPRFRALIAKAGSERAAGAPPHAYRDLFRELKALGAADA